jgi:hypothetical protein
MRDAGDSYGCKRHSHYSSAMHHGASFMLCPVRHLLARTRWRTSRSVRCVRSSGKAESGDMLSPHPATLTAVLDELHEQIRRAKARQVDQAETNAPAAAWLDRALSSAPATDAVSSKSRVAAALTGDLGRNMAAEIRPR